nr:hypothetical protein [Tanacetum cinerariifolium]
DRPDTISCVFKMKLDDLMEDIRKGNHFGRVKAGAYLNRVSKTWIAALSFTHFLHEHDKISSTDEINHVISTELPFEVDDPIAFNTVRSHMMHGPCGELYKSASCMSRDTCVKGFPKQYCEDTFITRDGWPHYRRSNNGRKVQVGRQNIMLDNRFVVPHNNDLIVKYDCHINVEWCNQGTLVKYPSSYLNKCLDRATVVIEGQRNETNNSTTTTNISNTTYSSIMTTNSNTTPNTTTTNNNTTNNNNTRMSYAAILQHQDKTEQHLSCRYILASESCWHLLGYEMHYRSVAIERLPFYEEGCNRVYFRGDDDVDNVIQRETAAMSKFTEWMKANEMYPKLGRDDVEWVQAIRSASQWKLGDQLRDMLVTILLFYRASDHNSFFKDVYQYVSEDVVRKQHRLIADERMYNANEEWSWFTNLADLIRVADLIIWDEAPLQHQHAFEAVDRTFRDIYRLDNPNADNQVFGEKAFVLSINIQLRDPTLDVTNADEIMRFPNWLIAIGDGSLPCIALDGEGDATWITILEDLLILVDDNPIEAIVSSKFLDLLNRIQNINYLKERCIMSPINDVVDKINSHVLESMSGEIHELLSADTICSTTDNLDDMKIMYPLEFLNTLRLSGVPNHKLKLKIGAPIILL